MTTKKDLSKYLSQLADGHSILKENYAKEICIAFSRFSQKKKE